MSAKLTIGFLGAGKMATALARGFIRAGLLTAGEVIASDPSEAARASFAKDVGAKTTVHNPEVAKFADVLVLAVKPDQVAGVLADIRNCFTPKHCLISIAAGVPLAKLEAGLGAGARLIRVMPNTPALECSASEAGSRAGSRGASHSRYAEHSRAGRRIRHRLCPRQIRIAGRWRAGPEAFLRCGAGLPGQGSLAGRRQIGRASC